MESYTRINLYLSTIKPLYTLVNSTQGLCYINRRNILLPVYVCVSVCHSYGTLLLPSLISIRQHLAPSGFGGLRYFPLSS